MEAKAAVSAPPVSFETAPDRYKHFQLEIKGPVAWLRLAIQEEEGLRPGYLLKLNSYDLGVDIELADAVQRLRFEHPEVTCVVVTSALPRAFCSGANIFMLASSTHAFKVNFCKFTNETRLAIEDASRHGQRYLAALNGTCAGGGYELALACDEIYLVDDRSSAVALPEVPYLGVLPGTGGLTRVVDKRMVRRDLADAFCTLAEGVKGKRAVQWGLVDGTFPSSSFQAKVEARAAAVAGAGRPDRKGVTLEPLAPEESGDKVVYRHVTLSFGPEERVARLELRLPEGADLTWLRRAFRELDDALLRLRFNHPEVGLVLLSTQGRPEMALKLDEWLVAHQGEWLVQETLGLVKRVLKRLDMTAKSLFALVEPGSCFAGTLLELALAADRVYLRQEEGVRLGLSALNFGPYPMPNGLTRLASRNLKDPSRVEALRAAPGLRGPEQVEEEGLATFVVDPLDWDDEVRLAVEERKSLSPDALTGMEASLRFAGPETMETKIFGRLTAWQNWIFQRPNAVGPRGALTLYGQPETAEFDFNRT
jgi:benzoyl-CoA-dihydrodiol lyase